MSPLFQQLPENAGPRLDFRGPHRAKVRFRSDPLHLGRVKVEVPGIHKENEDPASLPWARPCAAVLGSNRGDIAIPPVGTWVTVHFDGGDHAYPTYAGGWWVNDDRPPDPVSEHKRWTTGVYGPSGTKYKGGVLGLEPNAEPGDAPNNFISMSPLGKRLERDDRAGQQRMVLADQLDNGLFFNTEHGTVTLESWHGLQYEKPSLNGLLLTSRGGRGGGFQLFNERGWKISAAAEPEMQALEISAPSGAVFRIDDNNRLVEVWTAGGHRITASDDLGRIEVRSPEGRGLIIDDQANAVCLHSRTTGMYVLLDDGNQRVDVRSTGDLRIAADGNLILGATGNIIIEGAMLYEQSGVIKDINPLISNDFADTKVGYREAMPFFKRGYQEDEQVG